MNYVNLFFHNQLNLQVLFVSFALAIFILGVVRFGHYNLRQKMLLVYAHIALLIFPLVFVNAIEHGQIAALVGGDMQAGLVHVI